MKFEKRKGFKLIDSIEQLRKVMNQSGNKIRMKPGKYVVDEAESDNKTVFFCKGSDNYFDMRDVTIQIDTQVLADMRGGVHELGVYRILGDNITFEGAVFEDIGEKPPYRSLQDFSVSGDNCLFKDCTFIIRGSAPYGYGDLLGKGRRRIIKGLQKHSGVQITGDNTTLRRCKIINYAFGHCYFFQGGARNIILEDCYAEGRMRSTDEMLKDTSGPAFEIDFASVFENREGNKVITPGYMKCLAEDGFRTYSAGKITLINCVAKNTRSAFEISVAENRENRTLIKGCEAIECERGYMIGSNVTVTDSRGDFKYGPLLYLRGGSNSNIELELVAKESEFKTHALATIAGKHHKVKLFLKGQELESKPGPIKLGYKMPDSGSAASPINPMIAENIDLINKTKIPVEISEKAVDCNIETNGKSICNQGRKINII